MTATIVRLVLAVLSLLAGPVVWTLLIVILERSVRDETMFVIATVASLIVVTAGWIGAWSTAVRWSATRVLLTAASVVAAAIVGGAVGLLLLMTTSPYIEEIMVVFAGMVYGIVFPLASTLVWRETRAERAERLGQLGLSTVPCPTCGYNLTGLREARCPECGSQFTLEKLLASVAEQRQEMH